MNAPYGVSDCTEHNVINMWKRTGIEKFYPKPVRIADIRDMINCTN